MDPEKLRYLALGVQYFFFFFNVWLRWVFTAARSFSSCGEWGLLVTAMLGFSLCWLPLSQSTDSGQSDVRSCSMCAQELGFLGWSELAQ